MANVLAIKQRETYKMVNKKKVPVPPPSAANLAHAAAVTKADYWMNDGEGIVTSQSFTTTREINEAWLGWREDAKALYKKNHSKNRNAPSNTTLIDEMLLIIGTDVNLEDSEKLIKAYIKMFEKKYDTKILYWANHDHEGHIDDNGDEKINRHVHIFFSNINNQGKSVRKRWAYEYSPMQTDVYNVGRSVGLDIERAKKYEKGKAPRGITHKGYRKKKTQENLGDLRKEVKLLRSELQSEKAKRPDYALLDAENKRFIALLGSGDIDAAKAVEQLRSLIYTGTVLKKKGKFLGKTKIKKVAETWKARAENKEPVLKEVIKKVEVIKEVIKKVEVIKEAPAVLEFDINDFNGRGELIKELKAKNATKDTAIKNKDAQIASLESKLDEATEKTGLLESIIEKWAKFIKDTFGRDMMCDEPIIDTALMSEDELKNHDALKQEPNRVIY